MNSIKVDLIAALSFSLATEDQIFTRFSDFMLELHSMLKRGDLGGLYIDLVAPNVTIAAFLVGLESRFKASRTRADRTGLTETIEKLRNNKDIKVDLVHIEKDGAIRCVIYFQRSTNGGPKLLGMIVPLSEEKTNL